jgi:cellulose biosynthesis protein BcsQ
MIKICLFNHKGGVSKTTTAFNLGWMLARMGKRTLLVDADSQCNLTIYSIGLKRFEDLVSSKSKNNIKDALEPAFKAQPKLISSIIAEKIDRNDNLFLLPGNIDFSENEVQMGISFQMSNALGTMKNLPGAFNYLIEKMCSNINADYAIIDMNPSLSAINQDIFLCSDYFIIPTSPDLFSNMAIKSLARILPTWENWGKKARSIYSDSTYPLPAATPKFLGYTVNDFNLSYGTIQRSFKELIVDIGNTIENELVPALDRENMLINRQRYRDVYQGVVDKTHGDNFVYSNPYCLAQISNFNKLIANSNKKSIPIFELSSDFYLGSQEKTLSWFKFLYRVFSWKVQRLVSNDSCKDDL